MSLKVANYYVCLRKRKLDSVVDDKKLLGEFTIIKNPVFYWVADPFLITLNGVSYIIAEMGSKITGKGCIGIYDIDSKKGKWIKFFAPSYHISFPNTFCNRDGKLFFIPETFENGEVSIYEMDIKAKKQKLIKTLFLSNNSVDTVFTINTKTSLPKYLFSYDIEKENARLSMRKEDDYKVKIFEIIDYKKRLRPAGNIFELGDKMYLPTQNCERRYGGGLIFNQIKIGSNSFSLEEIKVIDSNDINAFLKIHNAIGCHTYNINDDYEVIDIIKEEFSLLGILRKIVSKLRRKSHQISQ